MSTAIFAAVDEIMLASRASPCKRARDESSDASDSLLPTSSTKRVTTEKDALKHCEKDSGIVVEFVTIDEVLKNLKLACSTSEFVITKVCLRRISDDGVPSSTSSNPSITFHFLAQVLPTTVTHLTMNHVNLKSGCAFAGDNKVRGLLPNLTSLHILDGCIESKLLLSEDFAKLKQITELTFNMPAFKEPTTVNLMHCLGEHLVHLDIVAVADQEIAPLEFPNLESLSLISMRHGKRTHLPRHDGFFITPENGGKDEDDEDGDDSDDDDSDDDEDDKDRDANGDFSKYIQLVELPALKTCDVFGCPRLFSRFEHARNFDKINELCTITC